jgi:hypothetical protein
VRLWRDPKLINAVGSALAALVLYAHVAAADPTGLGDTPWALPGIVRVGVVAAGAPRLSAAGLAGYGYTESQVPGVSRHDRISGALAVGYAPLTELELALRLDGRYDRHPSDQGTDDGYVGDPRLLVRGGTVVARNFHLGGDLGVWVPGNGAPSVVLRATTIDARVLAAWLAPKGDALLGSSLGFRLGKSARSAEDPARYSAGDRVALGLSEFNAALVGIGGRFLVGNTELLAESTADILVGSGAPSVSRSPIRLTAGPRHQLSKQWALELLGDVMLSKRPGAGPDDPFVPIEPRLSILAGLRFRQTLEKPRPVETAPPPPLSELAPSRKPAAAPAPAAPADTSVSGTVTDNAGTPVTGATVELEVGGKVLKTTSGEDGSYRIDAVPLGEGKLTISAPGYKTITAALAAKAGAVSKVSTQLEADLPEAQIRGMVRSFGGTALRAQVTVDPPGVTVETDDKGYFQVDVEPGTHQVTVRAQGYVEQRRTLKVDEGGVVVFNADLTKGR